MPSTPPLPSFRRFDRTRASAPHIRVPTARAVVDCAVYVDGHRLPGRFTHAQALAAVRERGTGFVWIGLHDPDAEQMNDIAETFALHPLAVEDAVQARQRPKLDRYDDTLFLVMRTVAYVEHEIHSVSEIVETGEMLIFIGTDFVVAVRHGEHSGLAGVRRDLEADPERLALGPGAVVHAIADYVVDSYIEVTAAVEHDVDAMEEEVFTGYQDRQPDRGGQQRHPAGEGGHDQSGQPRGARLDSRTPWWGVSATRFWTRVVQARDRDCDESEDWQNGPICYDAPRTHQNHDLASGSERLE